MLKGIPQNRRVCVEEGTLSGWLGEVLEPHVEELVVTGARRSGGPRSDSWLQTPPDIRGLGGAIFGDDRYDTVFIYHNGAESYHAAWGFPVLARVQGPETPPALDG